MRQKNDAKIIHKNGNKVFFDAKLKSWRYVDDGGDAFIPRACPHCKLFQDEKGIDACLPELTGVKAACCGHGITKGFIEFEDGKRVEGRFEKDRGIL